MVNASLTFHGVSLNNRYTSRETGPFIPAITSLGSSAIKNTISALEYQRNITKASFPEVPDVPLRSGKLIILLEKAAKRNRAKQRERGEISKAVGSFRDGYDDEDRLRLSIVMLKAGKTKASWKLNCRNRAMTSIADVLAYRGDELRIVSISDFGLHSVRDPDAPAPFPVSTLLPRLNV